METELLLKLLANGGISSVAVGVLVWIVTKEMPAQRAQFLSALKEERLASAKDRAADRTVRHWHGDVINAMAGALLAAGLKIVIPPRPRDEPPAVHSTTEL